MFNIGFVKINQLSSIVYEILCEIGISISHQSPGVTKCHKSTILTFEFVGLQCVNCRYELKNTFILYAQLCSI